MNDLSIYFLMVSILINLKPTLIFFSAIFWVFSVLYKSYEEFSVLYKSYEETGFFGVVVPKTTTCVSIFMFILGIVIPGEKYLILIGVSEFGEALINSGLFEQLYEKTFGEK